MILNKTPSTADIEYKSSVDELYKYALYSPSINVLMTISKFDSS